MTDHEYYGLTMKELRAKLRGVDPRDAEREAREKLLTLAGALVALLIGVSLW